jgi:hypothetical protein
MFGLCFTIKIKPTRARYSQLKMQGLIGIPPIPRSFNLGRPLVRGFTYHQFFWFLLNIINIMEFYAAGPIEN